MVLARIRRIDPFCHLYLGAAARITFPGLEKILEIALLIKPAQRKQAAYAGAAGVDAASTLSVQKITLLLFPAHPQIRKDNPVNHIQLHSPLFQ
jgi:hypothetical protein